MAAERSGALTGAIGTATGRYTTFDITAVPGAVAGLGSTAVGIAPSGVFTGADPLECGGSDDQLASSRGSRPLYQVTERRQHTPYESVQVPPRLATAVAGRRATRVLQSFMMIVVFRFASSWLG